MHRKRDLVLLAAGSICFVLFVFLPLLYPDYGTIQWTYLKQTRIAAGVFYGATATDLAQDIVGMRALASGNDPYPVLGPALEQLGIHWELDFHFPLPPTSFLFTAPVALFPWPTASLLWALLMIACWTGSLRVLGLNWNMSLAFGGLLLLWPPAAFSLGQLTPIWLLSLTAAYAWRTRQSGAPGAVIGLAAMTKYTPAAVLINFTSSPNRWAVLRAFVISWVAALAFITLLNANAIPRFLNLNQADALYLIQRSENASPLGILWRNAGWVGVLAWLGFLVAILRMNWQSVRQNSTKGWMVSFYLAVALLPVIWIYSLLPLLPVVAYQLQRPGRLGKIATLAGLVLSFLSPAFGDPAVPYISMSVFLFGLSFLFSSKSEGAVQAKLPESLNPRQARDFDEPGSRENDRWE